MEEGKCSKIVEAEHPVKIALLEQKGCISEQVHSARENMLIWEGRREVYRERELREWGDLYW